MRPCRPETEEVVCHALLVDVARNSYLEQIGGLSHASRKSSMNEINGASFLLQVLLEDLGARLDASVVIAR